MIKSNWYKIKKTAAYIKHYGPKKLSVKALSKVIDKDDYAANWEKLVTGKEELEGQRKTVFEKMPLISILVPVYNPIVEHFEAMIKSVLSQTYSNWELILVDASNIKYEPFVHEFTNGDDRVKYELIENGRIAANTNAALLLATGEYIALLDNDDTLAEDALYRIVEAINQTGAECLYSDEDKMDNEGVNHFCPHIKPDFDPILLRTNNYICHLFAVTREIANRVNGFNSEYDGAQDYDFILKCTEQAKKVCHIPRILYHWREHAQSTAGNPLSKLYAYEAGVKAICAHLDRIGRTGTVKMLDDLGFYRVDYDAIDYHPLVKIVVLGLRNKEQADEYFRYLRNTTDYDNYTICGMPDVDVDKIVGIDAEYVAVIMADTLFEDEEWLYKLVIDAMTEKVDVVAGKTTINEPFIKIANLNKAFLAFAGREYEDAFGVLHENVGKPSWYKGAFNRTILKSSLNAIPRTGILMKKEAYIDYVTDGYQLAEGKKAMYEPDVLFARF